MKQNFKDVIKDFNEKTNYKKKLNFLEKMTCNYDIDYMNQLTDKAKRILNDMFVDNNLFDQQISKMKIENEIPKELNERFDQTLNYFHKYYKKYSSTSSMSMKDVNTNLMTKNTSINYSKYNDSVIGYDIKRN